MIQHGNRKEVPLARYPTLAQTTKRAPKFSSFGSIATASVNQDCTRRVAIERERANERERGWGDSQPASQPNRQTDRKTDRDREIGRERERELP